jgi:hypothetical protein
MHLVIACIVFSVFLGSETAYAEDKKNAAPASEQITISLAALAELVKGAVIALHQANMTGNYSVLRDLGTPMFRERFDQTSLAITFKGLRSRKINLAATLLLSPNLTKQPQYTQDQLILTGDFPTQPLKVQFMLAFMQLDGVWRLNNIAVDAVEVQAMANAVQPAPTSSPPPGTAASTQWATGQATGRPESSKNKSIAPK